MAINGYVGALRAAGKSQQTIVLYRHYARHLAAHLGPDPWAVTALELEVLLGSEDWGASARKSLRTVVGGLYGWAFRRGFVASDPSADLPRVRSPKGAPRPTPEGVIRAALESAADRERLMIELGALAGLRAGEISRVHRDDLMLNNVLLVHGKGGKPRRVPIANGRLRTAIETADGWLFPNGLGGHLTPNHVSKLLSRHLGGKWTGHTLRHRFGTQAYQLTGDLLAVSRLLGHASTETTLIYVEMPDDHLVAAVLAVEALETTREPFAA